MKYLVYSLLIAFCFSSCGTSSSTSIQNSWTNSSASENLNTMNKVIVIAMTDDINKRKAIEDAYVQHIGAKAKPSYAYYNISLDQVSKSAAETKLGQDGYDGAVVVRLTSHKTTGSKQKASVSIDPSLYMNFHGNIGGGIGVGINPGHNTLEDQYDVNTSVYDIPQGQLLWSGDVQAVNPDAIETASNQVADQVFSKMKSDGFYNP